MHVALAGVSHAFGRRLVLDDVSLELAPGSATAVVGPSGAGKTTLLQIVGMLLRPERGRLAVDGRPCRSLSDLAPGSIAWIFQTMNVLGRRSVEDNVMLATLVRGCELDDARRRAHESLAHVGLADHLLVPARRLSGGEVQRLGVARALAGGARLIVADEPTAQLDSRSGRDVARLLVTAARSGAAVVIATHDPAVADAADRVVDLVDGRLEERA